MDDHVTILVLVRSLYQSDLLMAAPSPLSLDDGDKSLEWIRGHVVTFALNAEQDRFQGGIRRTAVKVRFPFLEEAARTGPPPEQILSSPRDPRLVSAPQDPRLAQHLRTQAPQDPRQKPQDPRRAGQASGAHMFLGEPRLIASTLCGAKAAETAFAGLPHQISPRSPEGHARARLREGTATRRALVPCSSAAPQVALLVSK